MTKFCFIDGRRYEIGDVVLDLKGGAPARVPVRLAEPDAWRWFVARCNPNCDERAAKSLDAAGLRVFQPQHKVLRGRLGHRYEAIRALFPRYLFVGLPVFRRGHGDEIDFRAPRRCDGVEDFVRSADGPQELCGYVGRYGRWMSGDEIVIAMMLDRIEGLYDDGYRPAWVLKRGDRVLVNETGLASVVATVSRVEPDGRIRVLIDMMGRKQPVKLQRDKLEVVG